MFVFASFLFLSLESAEILFYSVEKQKNAFLPTCKSRIYHLIPNATSKGTSNKINYKIM